MDKIQSFKEFLTTQSQTIPIFSFTANLVLAALLAQLLSFLYVRFGESLSNRRTFSKNFVLLSCTTMIIITIVKSSLALSLGLVGALSIVRFRAAIKEPEELAYLFISICIGLGLGANQTLVTTLGFGILTAIIFVRRIRKVSTDTPNLLLTVSCPSSTPLNLDDIIKVLKEHSTGLSLKRADESKDAFDASFLITFSSYESLSKAKQNLHKLSDHLHISYLDSQGISA